MLDVTIGIVNWNTREWLADCIRVIRTSPPLAGYEVRVVDNGSTDGSVGTVEREFKEVLVTENAGNLGYAAAANQALRQSSARYVLIMNTDVEIDGDDIDVLLDFADHHPDAGVVGPLILNPDNTVQPSGRRFPSFADATMHAFLGVIWPHNRFSARYKMLDWDRRSEREVDWVSGAAMLIRREAAAGVNYFDEGFFMYVEDLDFCYRLWKAGYKVYFCPAAKVTHHVAKSTEQSSTKMVIEFQRSLYRFYKKRYQDSWKSWLSPLVGAGLWVRAAFLIVARQWHRVWLKLTSREESVKLG